MQCVSEFRAKRVGKQKSEVVGTEHTCHAAKSLRQREQIKNLPREKNIASLNTVLSTMIYNHPV